jgi:hypothetical protein
VIKQFIVTQLCVCVFKNSNYNLTGSCFRTNGVWRMTKPKTGDVQSLSKMKVTRYHQQVNGRSVTWNHLLVLWHRLQTVRYEVLITAQGYLKADGWNRGHREWVRAPAGKIIRCNTQPPPPSKSKPAENLYVELERLTLNSSYWNLGWKGWFAQSTSSDNSQERRNIRCHLIRVLFAATPPSLALVGVFCTALWVVSSHLTTLSSY